MKAKIGGYQNLLRRMLEFNEKDRMSFDELFIHEFFREKLKEDMETIKEVKKKNNAKTAKSVDIVKKKMEMNKKKDFSSALECDKIDQKFCEYLESLLKMEFIQLIIVITIVMIIVRRSLMKKRKKVNSTFQKAYFQNHKNPIGLIG